MLPKETRVFAALCPPDLLAEALPGHPMLVTLQFPASLTMSYFPPFKLPAAGTTYTDLLRVGLLQYEA